ncbi:MAG: hypothetical protein SW833_25555 [Cyanobacteriota bacterium]|nr:hypothetical protein [Cyanobacteriota bacterium]
MVKKEYFNCRAIAVKIQPRLVARQQYRNRLSFNWIHFAIASFGNYRAQLVQLRAAQPRMEFREQFCLCLH